MISHFQNNLIARPYFSQEIFILDLQAWNTGEPGILLVSTIRIVRLVNDFAVGLVDRQDLIGKGVGLGVPSEGENAVILYRRRPLNSSNSFR